MASGRISLTFLQNNSQRTSRYVWRYNFDQLRADHHRRSHPDRSFTPHALPPSSSPGQANGWKLQSTWLPPLWSSGAFVLSWSVPWHAFHSRSCGFQPCLVDASTFPSSTMGRRSRISSRTLWFSWCRWRLFGTCTSRKRKTICC